MKKRLRSFVYAFEGMKDLISCTPNARIHLFMALSAVLLGIFLHISLLEWAIVFFCIGTVFGMESMNSAVEKLSDFVCQEKHPHIKKVKDIAAAGVLFVAIASLAAGCVVFIPKILALFGYSMT